LPQIQKKYHFSPQMVESGFRFILWGLFKKMVIADRLSVIVNQIYSNPGDYSGWSLLMATLFFGLQIYCDFSGYSDIAIGSSKLMGIRLMDNFRTPYFSDSFKDFWQRWHISLSTWFRDYVYITLGGNRKGQVRTYFNLFVTFLISGLWHGANYTFLVWGFLHGMYLIIERFVKSFNLKFKLPRVIKILMVYLLVNLAWVFFRADNMAGAMLILKGIFTLKASLNTPLTVLAQVSNEQVLSLFFGLSIFLVIEFLIGKKDINQIIIKYNTPVRWSIYYTLVIAILVFGVLHSAPQFIYFQF
jgi:alginate O-acetyltransferase complex protein AlgI